MFRRLALVGLLVPLIAAKPAPAPVPAVPPVVGDVVSSLKFDTTLTLLEPGAEPRAVVRYTPRAGVATFETVARTDLEMSMTMPDGSPMTIPLGGVVPPVVTTTRHVIGAPLANGLVPVTIEQLGSRTEGPSTRETKEMLATLKDVRIQLFVDASGQDPNTTELLQQLADQTTGRTAVFPTEPIGPGARWVTVVDLTISGLSLQVKGTHTARAITADGIDTDVTMALVLGEGGLVVPGLPPGTPPPITRFAGAGSGITHTDLHTLVSTGRITMDIDVGLELSVPGMGGAGMTMKMRQNTETRPLK